MVCSEIILAVKKLFPQFSVISCEENYADELIMKVTPQIFKEACLALHKILLSSVVMLFALDEREKTGKFVVNCVFLNLRQSKWITVSIDIPSETPYFDSLAQNMYSSSFFEREIWEMFGIEPKGNPDLRRLRLHDEVWPQGNFPLRKDFTKKVEGSLGEYKFSRVEGKGIFEIPVGPVHAGIIGPGHFRFSVAGEPIINLEQRLGFTHRGVEKLFEGRNCVEAIRFSECVSGDAAFAHSLAFALACEKICGVSVSGEAAYLRAIFLELERMYNHVNDIGGIATDVGFSFPAALSAIIKEGILQLNEKLCGSRYLKKINLVGGVSLNLDENKKNSTRIFLKNIKYDFSELTKILFSSVSFMDRVDSTGVLKKKTAKDIGVNGLAARASGIPVDLRKYFPGVYKEAGFKMAIEESGDVLARLRMRVSEFKESCRLIEEFLAKLKNGEKINFSPVLKEASALGYVEAWRGPVLYWLKTDSRGLIERCKIVDASFCNWQGLSYAVLGNIVPDFPVCNKSFDLSYSGNDL
ncbi:MAG: NADH-quinone oxidoreductase subunit C [Candidatus Omnitrophica bacterium]|nr:NADH-quinone oxidoreductase subunit C [Candidatus Omnitrophota bacterium]